MKSQATAAEQASSVRGVTVLAHSCSKRLYLRTGQNGWTCWPWAPISIFNPRRGCPVSPDEVTSHVTVNSWGPPPPHVIHQGEGLPWQQPITCTALAQPLPSLPYCCSLPLLAVTYVYSTNNNMHTCMLCQYKWRKMNDGDMKGWDRFIVSSLTCGCI